MNISDVMSSQAVVVNPSTTLEAAAMKMRAHDCGFLPVVDDAENALQGVVTDRDIVVRGIARGLNPKTTSVDEVRSEGVLYCYTSDTIEAAARSMYRLQVSRLVVLADPHTKRLCGVVSLGDLVRNLRDGGETLVGYATKGLKEPAPEQSRV